LNASEAAAPPTPAARPALAGAVPFSALPAGRVRRRTLALIRWIAIVGQIAAVLVVAYWLDFRLPLLPLAALIALSVLANLAGTVIHRRRIWLEDTEARLFLAFDLLQLAGLLVLTGGLANPFAVLILASVTVSASVLSARSTAALAALAVILQTLTAIWYLPLPWFDGGLIPDPLLLGGIWAGLVLATVFIALYIASLAAERRALGEALAATQAALAREQRLASLGGLAAAVAHELGSPLNTIMLVARDLAQEVPKDATWRADIELLVEESDRCRSLLAELANRRDGGPAGDDPFHRLPVSALIEAAGEPFRRERVAVRLVKGGDGPEPVLPRDPALLHGLGTLIQNAVQFARETVEIRLLWDDRQLEVTVADDGPGFEPQVLGRLGEPYVSGELQELRAGDQPEEPHMGLGVFIAQTLLGHTGARLAFRNRPEGGAEVAISWPIDHLERLETAS